MKNATFPLLNRQEIERLQEALHYMKMSELKRASLMLGLTDKGKKSYLIEQIRIFIIEGRTIAAPIISAKSLAKNYPTQSLASASLMLYGAYKNDLKSRNFFKQLIGPHFHFTAFGIDWLNERWQQGNPPTYQEFANFWIAETNRRSQEIQEPKDEWMFIRFMQMMEKGEAQSTKSELIKMWKVEQAQKSAEGFRLIKMAAESLR